MPKRTSPKDAYCVDDANDIDNLVEDKRSSWRASPAKARRRQRRYKKQLVIEVAERYQNKNV